MNNNKNKTIIEKINYDLIKESSLFSLIYNNNSQKTTSKNNSRKSSHDKNFEQKESILAQKKQKIEKMKNFIKNKCEKKIIKHRTNNSLNIRSNLIICKGLDEPNKKIKIKKSNNELINKNHFNITNDKAYLNKIKNNNNKKIENTRNNFIAYNDTKKTKPIHKKINTQINLNDLTNNFNIISQKRRKNNKSLYNFGNIYFINQNQIIKNDYEPNNQCNNKNANNNNNKHVLNYINNTNKIKLKNGRAQINNNEKKNNNIKENININNKMNPLNISNIKQAPKVIMDFSKYKKKGDFKNNMIEKKHPVLAGFNSDNNQEYYETQLISEN
jgi:hypothetical protein